MSVGGRRDGERFCEGGKGVGQRKERGEEMGGGKRYEGEREKRGDWGGGRIEEKNGPMISCRSDPL